MKQAHNPSLQPDSVIGFTPESVIGFTGMRSLREFCVDAPIPALIGVGQGVARHSATDAHVIELVLMSSQKRFDIAQALAEGELRKCHT